MLATRQNRDGGQGRLKERALATYGRGVRRTIQLRSEVPGDASAIRAVHVAAFGGQEEADVVGALSISGGSTASFVAVDEKAGVVGHVLFSPVAIDGPDGRAWIDGLAPLGVRPEFQREGVGAALVRHGLDTLTRAGRRAVVVLGHPSYYPKFGFRDARTFGLSWEVQGHEDAFMARELSPRALDECAGIVRYRPEVMGFGVRPAPIEKLRDIQALERLAASRFRASPHAAIAEAPPLDLEELARINAIGGLWVVTSKARPLAAYIAWEPLGGDAYVVEVDVHPESAGARLGAALLDHAALLAQRRGLSRLLLRTFSDVPWNAPYYRKLGFRELAEMPTALEETALHEAAMGFDMSRRVTMARPIR